MCPCLRHRFTEGPCACNCIEHRNLEKSSEFLVDEQKYDMTVSLYGLTLNQLHNLRNAVMNTVNPTMDISIMTSKVIE